MTMQKSPVIRLAASDNVVVARLGLAADSVLAEEGITVTQAVPSERHC